MNEERFNTLASRYPSLRVAVVGDFCLDRYLEIDPGKSEMSIETGLPVHNVVRVRSQPGAAGTILNNLSALGAGTIWPIGFAGEDGEGFELLRALGETPGVKLDYFVQTPQRRTFTYCKPLVLDPGSPPRELNRLDSKNWTPTPPAVEDELVWKLREAAQNVDCMIVLDQVDLAGTGVVTQALLGGVAELQRQRAGLLILADSRRGLADFPPVTYKMNAAELQALLRWESASDLHHIRESAVSLARRNQQQVFVTLSERGILGASPDGLSEHVPVVPLRGPIDIVGAGDAVSANLTMALAAGASLREALEMANAAASVVVHKLGTTGTARVEEIGNVLVPPGLRPRNRQ